MNVSRNISTASLHSINPQVIELLYLSIVGVFTLFGNCLVIGAFVFGASGIRTLANYFVVNLAISDLMVGCTSLPIWFVYRIGKSLLSSLCHWMSQELIALESPNQKKKSREKYLTTTIHLLNISIEFNADWTHSLNIAFRKKALKAASFL